jgi:hypothetical protein
MGDPSRVLGEEGFADLSASARALMWRCEGGHGGDISGRAVVCGRSLRAHGEDEVGRTAGIYTALGR